MPEGVEYLHQDPGGARQEGLRYQVLDTDAQVRERLSWPIALPPAGEWAAPAPAQEAPVSGVGDEQLVAWEFSGVAAESENGTHRRCWPRGATVLVWQRRGWACWARSSAWGC
ncbi:MAG: hypothetical protein U0232_15820 [Thermomicrobiales bacterium]